MKIGLNIGHYGTVGAVGFLDESKCAVEIYNELKPLLEADGHKVIPCNNATPPDYKSATKLANMYELDLVISIHLNSSIYETANGTEVLYYDGNEKGEKYAEDLSKAISSALGTKNRGAKPGNDIYIINNTSATCILLECLFVSNKEDCKKYNAKTIARAVANCLKPSLPNELESVNDIVWELANLGIITDKDLWLNKLESDKNSYWLARKCVNHIRKMR